MYFNGTVTAPNPAGMCCQQWSLEKYLFLTIFLLARSLPSHLCFPKAVATLLSALLKLLLAPGKALLSVNVHQREEVTVNRVTRVSGYPCLLPSLLFRAGATQVALPRET